jgi:outer membrane protein TolC
MKTLVFLLLALSSSLGAISLSEVINTSLSKSHSLESINARIEANKQNISISHRFSNPEFLLSTNSIDKSEPMSQTVVTLKQKIPYYSKRDAQENVALAQEELLQEKLRAAKVNLVAQIKLQAYTIWELQELYKIIDQYIDLTQQNIELYESYTSVGDTQHMGIMKAQLSLYDLEIQKSTLNAQLSSAYAQLSYLATVEVKELEISLSMGNKPQLLELQKKLFKSPALGIKEKELKKQYSKVSLASINNYPDFTLVAGYAYRENFENYFNLGLAIQLPIYGTEDAKEERSRALALALNSETQDTKTALDSQLKVLYAQLRSSYEIYSIVQKKALPQVAHMFDLSNSSISTGDDLFKYIDVLFSKLNLEKKSIVALSNYNKANANIQKLLGALQ